MNLTVINQYGQYVIDSREVAEMVDKRHADLLESIEGYVRHLTNGKFRSLDFFIASNYQDAKGEDRPCYLLTRKGCDMVANKMTGEKGVLFTAAYVTKFEEMEKNQPVLQSLSPQLQLLISMEMEQKRQADQLNTQRDILANQTFAIADLEQKVTNEITLTSKEQAQIQGAVKSRIAKLGNNKEHYSKLYSSLKKRFMVPSYKDIKKSDLRRAFDFINLWTPTTQPPEWEVYTNSYRR